MCVFYVYKLVLSRKNHIYYFLIAKYFSLKPNDVEAKPSNGTVELLGASNSRHDIHLPGLSPQKQPKFVVDGVKRPHERSLAGEQVNQDRGLLQEKNTAKKKSKFCGAYVRRSERIKSAIVCSPKANFGIEVENITVTDSEKDEVLAGPELVLEPAQEHESESEQEQSEKSLDEKVDSAIRRIDSLDKIVGWLKSKVFYKSF